MVRRLVIRTARAARRIVVTVIGTTVLLLGVALVFLPGPAMVVIPIGLAILGVEFAFARRWLRKLRDGASGVVQTATRALDGGRAAPAGERDERPERARRAEPARPV